MIDFIQTPLLPKEFHGHPILSINKLDSSIAYSVERYIKKMKSKQYIKALVKYPEMVEGLVEKYK